MKLEHFSNGITACDLTMRWVEEGCPTWMTKSDIAYKAKHSAIAYLLSVPCPSQMSDEQWWAGLKCMSEAVTRKALEEALDQLDDSDIPKVKTQHTTLTFLYGSKDGQPRLSLEGRKGKESFVLNVERQVSPEFQGASLASALEGPSRGNSESVERKTPPRDTSDGFDDVGAPTAANTGEKHNHNKPKGEDDDDGWQVICVEQ